MELRSRLSDGLAALVGKTTAQAPDVLLMPEKLDQLSRLSRREDILAELPELNQHDLLLILVAAADKASKVACQAAHQDPNRATAAALRDALHEVVRLELSQLPRRCLLYVPLASFPSLPERDIAFGPMVSLSMVPANWFTSRKRASMRDVGGEQTVALRVGCSGYVGHWPSASAVIRGLSKAREVLYLGKAFNAFLEKRGLIERAMGQSDERNAVYIHEHNSEKGHRIAVPARFMSSVVLLVPNSESPTLLGQYDANGNEDVAAYKHFGSRLDQLLPIFNAPNSDPDLSRLRSAVDWAFAASIADEASVSLVQSFIALEALLGDDDGESTAGSSRRLADRYSYLVGGPSSARRKLRSTFRDVYGMRNRIVHGNADRSTLEHEVEYQYRALQMAQDVIVGEANRYLVSARASAQRRASYSTRSLRDE